MGFHGMLSTDGKLAPFYFLVVFWGPEHRGYFVDYCLSGLLAPGNIPALENKAESRFVICTTQSDWDALQDDPLFRKLSGMVRPEFIEMFTPDPAENKMDVMSRGHKKLMESVFKARAYGINLNPDTIFADGCIEELQRLARAGKKLVFHAAIRFELEGVSAELIEKGYWKKGEPLAIKPREAVDIALCHKHAELKACDFDAPFFWDFPVHTSLDVPDEHGMVIHCFSWAPVLVSYVDVETHNTETLDRWTLDGDYIHKNFDNVDADRDVHVVRDSDEIFLLSITPKDEAVVSDKPHWMKSWPVIGRLNKAFLIDVVFNDTRIDPMKKIFFLEPVRMHSRDLNAQWPEVEFRLMKNIQLCLLPVDVHWGGYSVKDMVDEIRFAKKGKDLHRIFKKLDANVDANVLDAKVKANRAKPTAIVKMNKAMPAAMVAGRKAAVAAQIKIKNGLVRMKHALLRIPALVTYYCYRETIRLFVLVFAFSRVITLALLGNKAEQIRIKNRWRKIRSAVASRKPN